MLSTAQQMSQDSRTKIELLRMQIVKIGQVKNGELDGPPGKPHHTCTCKSAYSPLYKLFMNTQRVTDPCNNPIYCYFWLNAAAVTKADALLKSYFRCSCLLQV